MMNFYPDAYGFGFGFFPLMWLLIIWSLVWKGLALWKAAKKDDTYWFIALLVINTFGILEILYIYIFSERKTRITQTAEKVVNDVKKKIK